PCGSRCGCGRARRGLGVGNARHSEVGRQSKCGFPALRPSMTFAPFTVEVPATSANLGPGFDALGMALDIVNEVHVEAADRWELTVVGEGAERLPSGDRNLMIRTIQTATRRWGITLPPARLRCVNVV